MALPTRALNVLRNLRAGFPSGVLVGRRSARRGPAEFIPITEAANALLDDISAIHGAIIFRGASAWQALSPSTSGFVLKTLGSSADPEWSAAGLSLPYTDFDKIVFQSDFEGVNGQTDFTGLDDSLYNHEIEAANGSPALTNAAGVKFGNTALNCDLSSAAIRVKACDSEFQIGSGAFFIEFFIDADSQANARHMGIGATGNSDAMFRIITSGGGSALRFYYSANGTSWVEPLGSINGATGGLRHILIVRDESGNLSSYVNGTRDDTAVVSATFFASAADLLIGGAEETSFSGQAEWDGIRIGVGTTGGYDPTQATITVPTEYYGVVESDADSLRSGLKNRFYCKNKMLEDIETWLAASSDITASFSDITKELELLLSNTGVTPGTYGGSTTAVQITVDAGGRITNVSEVAIPQFPGYLVTGEDNGNGPEFISNGEGLPILLE